MITNLNNYKKMEKLAAKMNLANTIRSVIEGVIIVGFLTGTLGSLVVIGTL